MNTVDEEQVELLSTRTDKSFLKSISQLHMSQNTQSLGNLVNYSFLVKMFAKTQMKVFE